MSHNTIVKAALAAHLLRRVSVEAPADPRSIRKLLRGEPLSPMTRERIERALRESGLAHLIPAAREGGR